MTASIKHFLVACIAGLAAACTSVGPDYEAPVTQVPDAWNQELTRGMAEGDADFHTWWTTLDDPILDQLIDRSVQGNLRLKDSIARIQAARSTIGFAAGEQLPQVNATGLIEYSRQGERVLPDPLPDGLHRQDTLFSTGMDATWEIDLWGRIARSIEAADADFQASVEDYRDVLVSLLADVATAYVKARTFQQRIISALGNVRTQQQTLALVLERRRAGLASDLEVAQARLNLARTESSVPTFRQGLAENIHALGVLIGERPSALYPLLGEPQDIPKPPEQVLVGLPHELLRQRPDVRRAERRLAAQTAQVGVQTADLYPRFSLTGFFAFDSFDAGNWFQGKGLNYGFGPSVRWNVFDGARVRSLIDIEDATTQERFVEYEQQVLVALQETEDFMVRFVQESDRRDALERSVVAAADAVRLVRTLYVTGLTDFQNVQDTERNKFEQDDLFAESKGLVAENLIGIYRSLGGGWAARETRSAEADGDPKTAAAADETGTPTEPTSASETVPGPSAEPAPDEAALGSKGSS